MTALLQMPTGGLGLLALLVALSGWIFGGWTERLCATALAVPAVQSTLLPLLGLQPSTLLTAGLELVCLLFLVQAAFETHRWYPLIMAAAALIGLIARLIQFTGLGGEHLDWLQMPAGPIAIMIAALAGALALREPVGSNSAA